MHYSHQNNNKIKHFYERYLQLIQNDKLSSYGDLPKKDLSFSVHHINVQNSAIELFQIKHSNSRENVTGVFT